MRPLPLTFLLLLSGVAGSPFAAAEEDPYEQAPVFKAVEALSAEEIRGPHHQVAGRVSAANYLMHFELRTDYGLFRPESKRMLSLRINEVNTLALVRTNAANEFVKSLGKKLVQPAQNAVQFAKNPVQGVARLPKGLWSKTVGKVGSLSGKSKGSGAYGGGGMFAAEKRRLAIELGLDPYSRNPKVQSFLNELAQARGLGELAVSLAPTPLVVGLVTMGLDAQAEVKTTLATMSPEQIDASNDRAFAALGIPAPIRERFATSHWLSPTHKSVIAMAVKRLEGVQHVGAVLTAASGAPDEARAVLQTQQAAMLADHHLNREPIRALDLLGANVVATTRSGGFVIMLPLDYVYWSPPMERLTRRLLRVPEVAKASERTIYCTGRFSSRAARALQAEGFRVVPDTRPPMQRR